MNGYEFASKNPIFKDAVNQYVHVRIAYLDEINTRLKNGERGIDSIDPTYCDVHTTAEIYLDWQDCKTQNDNGEIKTRCCELKTTKEINHQMEVWFEENLYAEMDAQIKKLVGECNGC